MKANNGYQKLLNALVRLCGDGKIRRGDRNVEIDIPHLEQWTDHTPVLIDAIISSGSIILNALTRLREAGLSPGYCIGVHSIFADQCYAQLQQVVTTQTIPHPSN